MGIFENSFLAVYCSPHEIFASAHPGLGKRFQSAKYSRGRFDMSCKPCGIAKIGEKPKDNRTIWDFGGDRLLKHHHITDHDKEKVS